MMMQWGRLWRTLRPLKPVQIYARFVFQLSRPKPNLSPAPPLRKWANPLIEVAPRQSSLTGLGQFVFLNEEGSLNEHGWDGTAKSKLWRYNQHYFDDLNAHSSQDRTAWHHALIADWIKDNPPAIGSGWEPYPTALRIINWTKWGLVTGSMTPEMLRSLAVQTRWLMQRLEWHLLGNHLFVNAKALVFAGLFFEGKEADHWLATGIAILRDQIPEQILTDGGQFELSPMYHALAVEDMLDLCNIARAFGRTDLTQRWSAQVPKMLAWLETMTHPDREVAFFNDTAMAIAPSTDVLLGYAERMGLKAELQTTALTHLPNSGYVRLESGAAVVFADIAEIGPTYLPGHAHADSLSFELSLFGRRVIVNSGTSVYGTSAERLRQRGTAAHSTLIVDGQDSSEVWSGFRVGRRAKPFDIAVSQTETGLSVAASHDGFRHLSGAPVHRRAWHLTPSQLTVIDTISGSGWHQLETFLHLGLGCGIQNHSKGCWHLSHANGDLLAVVSIEGADAQLKTSTWHPQFGTCLQTQCLCLSAVKNLPHAMTVKIDWMTS